MLPYIRHITGLSYKEINELTWDLITVTREFHEELKAAEDYLTTKKQQEQQAASGGGGRRWGRRRKRR